MTCRATVEIFYLASTRESNLTTLRQAVYSQSVRLGATLLETYGQSFLSN
jgi:hypothetical protein